MDDSDQICQVDAGSALQIVEIAQNVHILRQEYRNQLIS